MIMIDHNATEVYRKVDANERKQIDLSFCYVLNIKEFGILK